MIIFHNKSPAWCSHEENEDTTFAGILTHVWDRPPPGIDDPKNDFLRYDAVIIEHDQWDPDNYLELVGKKVHWDSKTWTIESVSRHLDMDYGLSGQYSYQIAIRRSRRRQSRERANQNGSA